MRANIYDFDYLLIIVNTPPNSVSTRKVILINTFEWTREAFSFSGDMLFGGMTQMGVNKLASLLLSIRRELRQPFMRLFMNPY